jgi:hypothetical protein
MGVDGLLLTYLLTYFPCFARTNLLLGSLIFKAMCAVEFFFHIFIILFPWNSPTWERVGFVSALGHVPMWNSAAQSELPN